MVTKSPLFSLGTKVIGLTTITTVLFCGNVALGTTTQLAMIGQQYFANGTGIAYFNDGTTQQFGHHFRGADGYYYDESTPFYIDEVPGVGDNNGSISCGGTGVGSGGILLRLR